ICYPLCPTLSNEPCIRQCPDSEVVIRPSAVVVTLPGPILSNFPQHSAVGAIRAPVVGPDFEGSFSFFGLRSFSRAEQHSK
uniref:Keratin n=1 Tax=Chelonoidis abingdonii TaxID=106734 RepID=A0A8C0IYX3_CHEAB